MEWSISYNKPFVICKDDEGNVNEVLLNKITHVYGNDFGAGSAYSFLCLEGGEQIRVLGKSNEITESLRAFYEEG